MDTDKALDIFLNFGDECTEGEVSECVDKWNQLFNTYGGRDSVLRFYESKYSGEEWATVNTGKGKEYLVRFSDASSVHEIARAHQHIFPYQNTNLLIPALWRLMVKAKQKHNYKKTVPPWIPWSMYVFHDDLIYARTKVLRRLLLTVDINKDIPGGMVNAWREEGLVALQSWDGWTGAKIFCRLDPFLHREMIGFCERSSGLPIDSIITPIKLAMELGIELDDEIVRKMLWQDCGSAYLHTMAALYKLAMDLHILVSDIPDKNINHHYVPRTDLVNRKRTETLVLSDRGKFPPIIMTYPVEFAGVLLDDAG